MRRPNPMRFISSDTRMTCCVTCLPQSTTNTVIGCSMAEL